MDKAADMRALSKKAKSNAAKRKFDQAADRLELRAAKGADKAGRRRRKTHLVDIR
jgi:hypothetical protein